LFPAVAGEALNIKINGDFVVKLPHFGIASRLKPLITAFPVACFARSAPLYRLPVVLVTVILEGPQIHALAGFLTIYDLFARRHFT
jgi:hypothetical protein